MLISWNSTNQCNLYCEHCYRDAGARLEEELSTAEACKMIQEIKEAGFKIMIFSGGEPVMRPDIYELIAYASKIGLRFKAAIWVSPNNLISQQVLNIVLGPVTANITQLSSQLPGHNGKFAEVVYLYRDGRAFYGSAQVYPLINRVIVIEDTGSLAFLELGRIKFQGQAYHPFKLVAAFSRFFINNWLSFYLEALEERLGCGIFLRVLIN
jgi:hypothetical protein